MKRKILNVRYKKEHVGTLVMADEYRAAFQYTNEWIKNGFSISPFLLPLNEKLYMGSEKQFFDGLHGVFSDSLPDGWGKLLVDRVLRKNGINPIGLNPVDRLAVVGESGMGALTYEPEFVVIDQNQEMTLDVLAEECRKVLYDEETDSLDALFLKGGSSGGARPKALLDIDGEAWIVKFPNREDSANIGKQEYDYSLCARECNVDMTETRLFSSNIYKTGIFGTKRFDRMRNERIHMVSVCGLLETSHRIPSLDYNDLMKINYYLTRDNEEQIRLFRYMCFNVFAHNRDDHSKNFSYLYDAETGKWHLAPAYDLTYSNSINGWHATTVNGNGENPTLTDILEVAQLAGINKNIAKNIAEEIRRKVSDFLGEYLI